MVFLPKVSVILPVYNAGANLIPCVESLLAQTLKEIEIVIINDASTDDSAAIIEGLARQNENVVTVHLDKNKGVHEARLAGLREATAPWIGFLDADDFAREKMFGVMYQAGLEQDVDIVVCGSYRVTSERKLIAPKLRFKKSERVDSGIFSKFCDFDFGTGMLWNKLYRRQVVLPYADMHFPWRQNINEDLVFNIGAFLLAKSVYLCKEVLHEYVLNESSVTSTIDSARAYVETYRAAALAVSIFSEQRGDAIPKIIDMYRKQLSFSDYRVENVAELLSYEDKLQEATKLIHGTYPVGLALLSARRRPDLIGVKMALESLFRRILSIGRPKSNISRR